MVTQASRLWSFFPQQPQAIRLRHHFYTGQLAATVSLNRYLCIALIGLCGSIASAQYTTLDLIQQRGAIQFGIDPNNLPFSSTTNEPPGFDIEIAQVIAKHLGVSCQFVWLRAQHPSFPGQLMRKKCDALIGVATQAFAKNDGIAMTRPYLGNGFVFALARGSQLDRTKPVGVEPGVVRTEGHLANTRDYPSQAAILGAIAKGEIAAGYVGAVQAGWTLKNQPDWQIELSKEQPRDHWNFAVAVRKRDTELKAALDKIIQQMLDQNEIEPILKKYGIPFYPPFQ